MPLPKMEFDTPQYLRELDRYRRLRGFKTMGEAEFSLYPIRSRKRQLKSRERAELLKTVKKSRD